MRQKHDTKTKRAYILVLVDEIVAMKHVNAIPGSVVSLDQRNFILAEPNHIFQTGRLLEHDVNHCRGNTGDKRSHKAQLLDRYVG
jgi:hypothetical protein